MSAGYPSHEWHLSRAVLRAVVNDTVEDRDAAQVALAHLVTECRMVEGDRL